VLDLEKGLIMKTYQIFKWPSGACAEIQAENKTDAIKYYVNSRLARWCKDSAYDASDDGREFLQARHAILKNIRNAEHTVFCR